MCITLLKPQIVNNFLGLFLIEMIIFDKISVLLLTEGMHIASIHTKKVQSI